LQQASEGRLVAAGDVSTSVEVTLEAVGRRIQLRMARRGLRRFSPRFLNHELAAFSS
jgi:hypothetical protein